MAALKIDSSAAWMQAVAHPSAENERKKSSANVGSRRRMRRGTQTHYGPGKQNLAAKSVLISGLSRLPDPDETPEARSRGWW